MARPEIDEILRDTELLSIVGAINIEWDEIEVALWRVFWDLLGGTWKHSYAIYYSQQNHRARREMIESLALVKLPPDGAKAKRLKALLGRVKRAATKRNEISHGVWSYVKTTSGPELWRVPLKKKEPKAGEVDGYSKADLKALRDQLTKLRDDLDGFYA